jgi:SCY1-like protein 1
MESIFTTKSGEWKLLGFEILSNPKEENNAIVQYASHLSNSMRFAPPEIQKTGWTSIQKFPTSSSDTWAFACLINEIFNGSGSMDLGRDAGKIPRDLFSLMKPLLNANPSARSGQIPLLLEKTSGGSYFDNEIIRISNFLEQWALKESK